MHRTAHRGLRALLPAGIMIAVGVLPIRLVHAGEPMLNYSYTTDLLPKNRMQFDQWLTLRTQYSNGLFTFYSTRDEVQYGLTNALQLGAFVNTEYVNILHNGTDGTTQPPEVFPVTADPDARFERWKFDSVGVDMLYRIRSPYTDPLGVGIYFSPIIGPGIRMVESRLLLQKNFIDDRLICTFNLVDLYEYRWTLEEDSSGDEAPAEGDVPAPPEGSWGTQADISLIFGVSYRFASNWSAGLEFQNIREYNGGWYWLLNTHRTMSTYYLGPTLHYGGQRFYATFTWMPQLPLATGFTDEERASIVNGISYSTDFERQQFRLKVGWYFDSPFLSGASKNLRGTTESPADTTGQRTETQQTGEMMADSGTPGSAVAPAKSLNDVPPPPTKMYFSQQARIQAKIIKRINEAKLSIDLAEHSFTSGEIAQALVRAHQRGVAIRMVRDSRSSGAPDDKDSYLIHNGIRVQTLAGRPHGGAMRHPFAVFDRKEVLTGGYSWAGKGGKSNTEEVHVTQESAVVRAYREEFNGLWKSPQKAAAHKKGSKRIGRPASL